MHIQSTIPSSERALPPGCFLKSGKNQAISRQAPLSPGSRTQTSAAVPKRSRTASFLDERFAGRFRTVSRTRPYSIEREAHSA